MRTYYIQSIVNKSETLIIFQGNTDRLVKCFVLNDNNDKFLQFSKLVGVAQRNLREKDLRMCDYLQGIVGIPIFSSRFMNEFSPILNNEVDFYPIEIQCNGIVEEFYLAKIKNYIDLIDYEKSGFRTLRDGSKILSHPRVINKSLDNFLIARDKENKSEWVVSEEFKNIADRTGLKMKFYETL